MGLLSFFKKKRPGILISNPIRSPRKTMYEVQCKLFFEDNPNPIRSFKANQPAYSRRQAMQKVQEGLRIEASSARRKK